MSDTDNGTSISGKIAGVFGETYKVVETNFYQFLGNFAPGALTVAYLVLSRFWRRTLGIPETLLNLAGSQTLTILVFLLLAFVAGEGLFSLTSRLIVLPNVHPQEQAKLWKDSRGIKSALAILAVVGTYLITFVLFPFRLENPMLLGTVIIAGGVLIFAIFARQPTPLLAHPLKGLPGLSEDDCRIWWIKPDPPHITLAEFGRYFFTLIDVKRKELAGKFGWIVFYGNAAIVFLALGVAELIRAQWLPSFTGLMFLLLYPAFLIATVYSAYRWGPVLVDARADFKLQEIIENEHGPIKGWYNLKNECEDKGVDFIVNELRNAEDMAKTSAASLLFTKAEELVGILRRQEVPGATESDLDIARGAFYYGNPERAGQLSLRIILRASEWAKNNAQFGVIAPLLQDFVLVNKGDPESRLYESIRNLCSYSLTLHYFLFNARKGAVKAWLEEELKRRRWVIDDKSSSKSVDSKPQDSESYKSADEPETSKRSGESKENMDRKTSNESKSDVEPNDSEPSPSPKSLDNFVLDLESIADTGVRATKLMNEAISLTVSEITTGVIETAEIPEQLRKQFINMFVKGRNYKYYATGMIAQSITQLITQSTAPPMETDLDKFTRVTEILRSVVSVDENASFGYTLDQMKQTDLVVITVMDKVTTPRVLRRWRYESLSKAKQESLKDKPLNKSRPNLLEQIGKLKAESSVREARELLNTYSAVVVEDKIGAPLGIITRQELDQFDYPTRTENKAGRLNDVIASRE